MRNWQDIFKIFKTALMILAVVCCLAACSNNKSPSPADPDVDLMEDEQSELDEQQRSCWQSGLLEMFYNAMAESSVKAYPNVTKSAMPFMMVAFAVWLSLRLLKHVGSVVAESSAEVWTEVGRMAVVCLFCGLLASSTSFLLYTLNTFILPIYYAFLEYGSQIIELASKNENVSPKGQMLGETCLLYTNSLTCKAPALTPVTINGSRVAFPSGPGEMMSCLVCATNDRLQLGFLISKEMLGATSITSWIAGIIVFFIFLFVKLAFVFYLIDAIFRMNIVVIILPFLILAVPFKATRKWSVHGLKTILNSAAIMMCLAIIATMTMLAMQMIINDNIEYLGSEDTGGSTNAFKQYEEFGVPMLSIILMAFLILKSCGLAVSLAGSLVGGGGSTNFQKRIAKLGAWVAKGLAGFITAGASSMVSKTLGAVIDNSKRLREARNKYNNFKSRVGGTFDHLAGRDQGGDE